MISILGTVQYIDNVACVISTYFGLSTDSSKPTDGVGNGSAFVEMDTSKIYFFDSDSQTWLEWGAEAQSASTLSMAASPTSIRPNLGLNAVPDVSEDEPEEVQDTEPEEEEEEEQEEGQEEQSEEEAR